MPGRKHKYAHEQLVEVDYEGVEGHVKIVALCEGHCAAHQAPMYGCVAGDQSFSFCEESIRPLSQSSRRKLN